LHRLGKTRPGGLLHSVAILRLGLATALCHFTGMSMQHPNDARRIPDQDVTGHFMLSPDGPSQRMALCEMPDRCAQSSTRDHPADV
jgi:hypothetical protein